MSRPLDKRGRSTLFRVRLAAAMLDGGQTQAGLARSVGVNRSTISQLLDAEAARLPNAQVAAECAAQLGVSADWLLGLSDRKERAADLVRVSMSLTEAPRALLDETIFGWHREAAGYKVRHVPAQLPDMLKSEAVMRWEYEPSLGRTFDQALGASRDRLDWMRGARSDYEVALPLHELFCFARGQGYYEGLPPGLRREQIAAWGRLYAQLYPTLRVHLFDARKLYSAPVTVFGPLLAVLYIGRNYLAFRDAERVEAMTRHFDDLVRGAEVPSRDFPAFLDRLGAEAA